MAGEWYLQDPDSAGARIAYRAIIGSNHLGRRPFELGALPWGRFSGGKDINDALQVTGWSEIRVDVADPIREVHAFLWTKADGMQDLGALTGTRGSSQGEAINQSGQIAGFSDAWIGASVQPRAFRYTPGVGMISLGTLSGGDSSRAYGINDLGHVVGESTTRPVFGSGTSSVLISTPSEPFPSSPLIGSYAFLWTEETGMRNLGSLGGDSVATAINNNNVVVGYSELTDGSSASPHTGHAFRWTAEEGMIDLNDLLPFGSRWELLNAYDINDHGQIVGSGRTDGQIRAYRLSPVRIEVAPSGAR